MFLIRDICGYCCCNFASLANGNIMQMLCVITATKTFLPLNHWLLQMVSNRNWSTLAYTQVKQIKHALSLWVPTSTRPTSIGLISPCQQALYKRTHGAKCGVVFGSVNGCRWFALVVTINRKREALSGGPVRVHQKQQQQQQQAHNRSPTDWYMRADDRCCPLVGVKLNNSIQIIEHIIELNGDCNLN